MNRCGVAVEQLIRVGCLGEQREAAARADMHRRVEGCVFAAAAAFGWHLVGELVVDRYLVAGTCIALDIASGEVYAPYGLEDVEQGVLRINPLHPEPALFLHKARSYQARWPWLKIVEPG